MKTAKPAAEKKTPGAIQAEEIRARCNKLTETQREKLGKQFMKLYYGGELKPTPTRRR